MALEGNRSGVIVIGIDFGTTFTGVAYDYIKSDTQSLSSLTPQALTLWQTSDYDEATADCPKVPSNIAYSPGGKITWGQENPDEPETVIRWFKLLLLDKNDLQSNLGNSEHVEQARQIIEKTGKNVITVISDYLTRVWEHVLKSISRARGQHFLHAHSFHVVVTVPAIWQDYAVQKMEQALKKAGILNKRPGCQDTTHAIVSEPEAAALAAIYTHHKYDSLEPGEAFVIADLGGGTVDLVSFRVKAIQPQLVLEEIVEGEGALCGATFLDQAFLACIEQKLRQKKRDDKNLKPWNKIHKLERKRILDTVWEKGIKRKYYDGQGKGYRIDLGAQGNRRPDVLLAPNDLNDTFNSVFEKISELIERQVEAILKKNGSAPKFIVLNGGFGRCQYIYRKLSLQYEGRVEILFEESDMPWTAIARGAVLSGAAKLINQTQVESHVSRYSYGWAKFELFDHHIHDPEDLKIHELTGLRVARDQMEWIILRGESVKSYSQVYEYERYFEVDEVGFASFSEPIYRSRLSKPPKRMVENEDEEHISNKDAEPAEFRELAVIDMTTPVPVERLPKRGGTRFPHRMLTYRVEVNVSGACLNIKATAIGKEIGEKTISGLSDLVEG